MAMRVKTKLYAGRMRTSQFVMLALPSLFKLVQLQRKIPVCARRRQGNFGRHFIHAATPVFLRLCLLQRSEQYFTSRQTFRHFLRQVNGLPQVAHSFLGKLALAMLTVLPSAEHPLDERHARRGLNRLIQPVHDLFTHRLLVCNTFHHQKVEK